jgi:hypothetical protein
MKFKGKRVTGKLGAVKSKKTAGKKGGKTGG